MIRDSLVVVRNALFSCLKKHGLGIIVLVAAFAATRRCFVPRKLDAMLHTTQLALEQIARLKNGMSDDDDRWKVLDDAELGMEWVLRRLRNLNDSAQIANT